LLAHIVVTSELFASYWLIRNQRRLVWVRCNLLFDCIFDN